MLTSNQISSNAVSFSHNKAATRPALHLVQQPQNQNRIIRGVGPLCDVVVVGRLLPSGKVVDPLLAD